MLINLNEGLCFKKRRPFFIEPTFVANDFGIFAYL
jgi:hypothetical protein